MFEEAPSTAWRLRFGEDAPAEADRLGRFFSHRSVRRFQPDPVPETLVRSLIGAAQSAATSSNLQLWSVVTVQQPDRRAEMVELCAGQRQVAEAAWFFAFVADHHRLRHALEGTSDEPDALGTTEMFTVSAIDAALAAERMVCAAEAVGLGICYIGAMRNDPVGVAKLLELPHGTIGLFGLCVGWPDESKPAEIKPRLLPEAVWHREMYGKSDVTEYDERMAAFYETQGMDASMSWSRRSGRRTQHRGVGIRHAWGDALRRRGFCTSDDQS
ncbi:MAG: NADPH-dependent oxidoreductase [Fimbriimonadaceae bacterium]